MAMFSLKVILISSLGLIIICLIRPTSEKPIKTLIETTKSYLKQVVNLDSMLKLPSESIKNIGKIKYKHNLFKIRSGFMVKKFIQQLQILTKLTKVVVSDYIKQINGILSVKPQFGTIQGNNELLESYNNKFWPKLQIDKREVKNKAIQDKMDLFLDELGRLNRKIIDVTPEQPPEVPTGGGSYYKVKRKEKKCFLTACFIFPFD